jgi:hypothetical protein
VDAAFSVAAWGLLWLGYMADLRASERRQTLRGGRRESDPAVPVGNPLLASVLWHLPDNTRCWLMRHKGKILVRVSRESRDLRIEVFESEPEAAAQADAWCIEYGASQVG